MSSNPNPSLPFRSITDIMSPYRNSFRDIDFRYILSALISREEFLTRDLNLRLMQSERDQRRLKRELSAIKHREAEGIRVLELEKRQLYSYLEMLQSSSIECIHRIEGLIRVVDGKNEEMSRLLKKLSDIRAESEKTRVLLGEFKGVVWRVEELEKEKSEIEVKLDEFRSENECLVPYKVKFDEELPKLESVSLRIKDKFEGLRRVLGEKNKEICGKDERIEVLMRKVEALEKQKSENEVKFEEIRRENESLVGDVGKFDEELNKLKMEKRGFEIERIEFRKENEYLIAAKKGYEEQLGKLKKEKIDIEVKLEKLQRENQRLVPVEEVVDELLKKERIRCEIKLEEFTRKNEYLIAKVAKSNEELKSLREEMDGKIMEMKKKNDVDIENLGREKEVEIQELKKTIEGLETEKSEIENKLKVFQRENESLVAVREKFVEQLDKSVKENIENEIKVAKFQRDNEYLKALKEKSDEEMESLREVLRKMDVALNEMKKKNDAEIESLGREKEVKIDQLEKKNEGLEMEKIELMKKNEETRRDYEKMEQQVVKLEEDVARLLLVNVPNPNKLTDDQIEKVLSCVFDGLDSEEDGVIGEAEKVQRGAPAASSKPAVNTTPRLETEVSRETKRPRVLSQCSNQKNQSDDDSQHNDLSTQAKDLIAACRRSRGL